MAVSASKVYAEAFYDVAGASLDASIKDLRSFAEQCAGSPPLKTVLMGAAVEAAARQKILDDLLAALGTGDAARRLLKVLLRRSRLPLAGAIAQELEAMKDRREGILTGELKTAVTIDSAEVEGLAAALSKRVGRKVKLQQKVDPSVLGGFVAKVGGKTYDASLRTQLNKIKNELI